MFPKIWIFDSYSLMLLLGLIFCFVFVEIYGRRKNVNRLLLSMIEIDGAISIGVGLIGAVLTQNLYDLIEKGSSYIWTWAMTFYGGLLFGVATFLLFYFLWIKKKQGPCMTSFILLLAPFSIAIAQGFGRIGCFLAGCCYGRETDSWIGVTFPGMSHKVVPTNLMEAVFLFLLAALLLWIAFSKHAKWGFPIYLFGYSLWRFIIEFYRGDHRGSFIPGLSPSQFWSIVMFFIGIAYTGFLICVKRKERRRKSES